MASCIEITEQGFLYQSETPVRECSSLVVLTVDEYNQDHFLFEPSAISGVFFFGFGMVLLSYKTSFIVGALKSLLNKL